MTDGLNSVAIIVAAVSALAFVEERLIEAFIKPLVPENLRQFIMPFSAVVGVVICFAFALDVITPLLATFGVTPAVEWAGTLITGLAMGGGANFLSDIWPGQ